MAKNLSKETLEEISSIFESFNNKLASLARDKIMNAFSVGSNALDLIGKNVNGIKQNSDEVTKKILGSYHVAAQRAETPSISTPSAGPSKPSGPSNAGPSSVAPQ